MSRSTTSLASSLTRVERYDRSVRNSGNSDLDMADGERDNSRHWRASGLTARDENPSPPLPTLGETSSSHNAAKSGTTVKPDKSEPTAPPTPPGPAGPVGPGETGGPGGPGGPAGLNGLYQPKSPKFWLTLVANFLAMFLVALDRTILSTAIPTITDEFHSLGDIGWYGSAYMLTTACSQLIFGRLYKHYNMKWVFLSSVIIFEIGSAVCGGAPNSPVFIAGRAIAGLGSAGIFSGAMMIMIPMVPLHKRPMFQSMFGMIFGIASVLGPLVGGAFTSGVTWRWCFWINLPVGGFTLIFMLFFWNPPSRKTEPAPLSTHIKRLDPLGAMFFIPAVVCLLLALEWGGSTYPWDNWRIVMLFGLFGILFLAYGIVQHLTPETASIPTRVITQRSVFLATMFTFFIAGSMLMLVYYLPIWFQTVKLVNPLRSGIYTLPLVLSLVASSILNGIGTQKLGYYVPSMLLSPSIMAIGEGLLSTLTRSSSQAHWVGFQFLSGFGLGMGMQTGSLAVQTVLPPGDLSIGVALIFFAQQLGGAVFTTVGQTILSNLLVSRLAGIPGINPEEIARQGATELVNIVPAEDIDLVISAYDYTLTRIFLAAMGLAFAALLSAAGMEWKTIKKPGPGGPGGPPGAPGGPGGPGKSGEPDAMPTEPPSKEAPAVQNGIPMDPATDPAIDPEAQLARDYGYRLDEIDRASDIELGDVGRSRRSR